MKNGCRLDQAITTSMISLENERIFAGSVLDFFGSEMPLEIDSIHLSYVCSLLDLNDFLFLMMMIFTDCRKVPKGLFLSFLNRS